jgi:hypothetical protein
VPTSTKANLRWRDTSLTFVCLRRDGALEVAHTVADKAALITAVGPEDCVLAVRQVQYPTRQEVMVVDDLAAPREALACMP